jgi:hypothetical protein
MAEAVLYENPTEPQFPYQLAVKSFQWVLVCINSVTGKRRRHQGQASQYMDLINILLVLTRARISTMIVSDGSSV